MTIRVAALDCGTNSLRLLITDLDEQTGRAVDLLRRTTIVRLGQDVDRTGVFSEEAVARTFAALDDAAELIDAAGPTRVRLVATSAVRDVTNRQAFLEGVVARVGVEADILTGDEEARLSYVGATRELSDAQDSDVDMPLLVVDIGGGSTELVSGGADSGILRAVSLDIGSVRLTERHLHDDPATASQVAATIDAVQTSLDGHGGLLDEVGTLIGVAGTVTTMAAMVLGLRTYDDEQVHRSWLRAADLFAATRQIVAMSVAERRRLGFMHPGRADVIGGGALVLQGVVRRSGMEGLLVSEHDILDGVAWSLV